MNIAVLRAKGISDGVEFHLPNNLSGETLKVATQELRKVSAKLYKKFVKPVKLEASLNEVEMV